jgi:hypothetical protein
MQSDIYSSSRPHPPYTHSPHIFNSQESPTTRNPPEFLPSSTHLLYPPHNSNSQEDSITRNPPGFLPSSIYLPTIMKLFSFLTLATLPFTGFARDPAFAGCYKGGEMGDTVAARNAVKAICAEGTFSGMYANFEKRMYCLPLGSVRYQFWIWNFYGLPQAMDSEFCGKLLHKEINCRFGGHMSYPQLGWEIQ